jgi:hypothetical protein
MVVEPASGGGGIVGLTCSPGFLSAKDGLAGGLDDVGYHRSRPVSILPFSEFHPDTNPVILF